MRLGNILGKQDELYGHKLLFQTDILLDHFVQCCLTCIVFFAIISSVGDPNCLRWLPTGI